MEALGLLLNLLAFCLGIGSLVCFILVLIKMFQNNETTMGIVCIVTLLLCGLGGLIAFILGWINVSTWRIQQIMMIWTLCVVVGILLNVLLVVLGVAAMGMPQPGMGQM